MINLLHTADWHIGQTFHQYDRTKEHEYFLSWLTQTLVDEAIDVLLISGDVFDLSNPSAQSVKLFYSFLNKATKAVPNLQIIITAGNHDSSHKLESVTPLLESTQIRIVGYVEKREDGNIDFDKVTIPIKDKNGVTRIQCLAIPYLRSGDINKPGSERLTYAEEVTQFYNEAYDHVKSKLTDDQAIIAMGHLHVQSAEVSAEDQLERSIMGGIESLSASAFHPDIQYVALGHIHKVQAIGGNQHIRYSGSPIPMSFSEKNYQHQVVKFSIQEGKLHNLKPIEVPVSIPVLSIPKKHSSIDEVLNQLNQLSQSGEKDLTLAPYLEVRVLETEPDPARKTRINEVLKHKYARLAVINVKRNSDSEQTEESAKSPEYRDLKEQKPEELFNKIFQSNYKNPPSDTLLQLFNQALEYVNNNEEQL